MIASGARLEAYDVHFGPPLHIACAKEHMDCVKEMLKAGQSLWAQEYTIWITMCATDMIIIVIFKKILVSNNFYSCQL